MISLSRMRDSGTKEKIMEVSITLTKRGLLGQQGSKKEHKTSCTQFKYFKAGDKARFKDGTKEV